MSKPDFAGNESAQNAANESAVQGPQAELPDAAPDFVGEIHAAINDFLAGSIDNLGEAVSEIASSVDAGQSAAMLADVASVVPL